jgi:hypothetical protein
MRRFQIVEHSRNVVRGEIHVQARLWVRRRCGWITVGIFQMRADEWQVLIELCREHGMKVTRDAEALSA